MCMLTLMEKKKRKSARPAVYTERFQLLLSKNECRTLDTIAAKLAMSRGAVLRLMIAEQRIISLGA